MRLRFTLLSAMWSGSCIFCNHQCLIQLSFRKDIIKMPRDNRLVSLKQQYELILRQPHSVILQFDIQAGLAVFSLIEDDSAPTFLLNLNSAA